MSPLNPQPQHNPALIVAVLSVALFWILAKDPASTSTAVRKELARKYHFSRADLPNLPGVTPRDFRPVAVSLQRLQQWCSSLTSGVSMADLDGDGIPNDLLFTDTQTERLVVCPVPGSTTRYAPFVLTTNGFDRTTAGPSGAVVGDYNEDGLADVLVLYVGRAPLLYIRTAQSAAAGELSARSFKVLEVVPEIKKQAWATSSAALADLDGDGHLDLLVGNYFPDWCDIYNPKETRVQEMHNNNGWACNGGGIHFFLWRKPTKDYPYYFREVKNLLPDKVLHGWVLAIGAQDLDGDMLPDIYVGNDLGPDRLLWNRSTPGHLDFRVMEGHKSFNTPGSFVMGQDKYKGMSCDFADVNGDGIADFFVSNVASNFALHESHFLWVSRKDGKSFSDGVAPYEQASERYGVSRGGWGWDSKFESYRNQVNVDLFQARGFIRGTVNRWPELQSLASYNTAFVSDPRNWPTFKPGVDIAGGDLDAFYAMDANGKYHDIGGDVGFSEPMVSRGIATADVDGNGRMDIAVSNMWAPNYFFKNNCPQMGHFLGLRLVTPLGKAPKTPTVLPGRPKVLGMPAVGATAWVSLPCGRVLTRQVDGGNGHSGRRAPELHFGLGDLNASTTTVQVKLRWRETSGVVAQPVSLNLGIDRWYTVILGQNSGKEDAQ
jgi:hypothetical protein